MADIVVDYGEFSADVNAQRKETHREILDYLRRPGCWFTGRERHAIVGETRAALACTLCQDRKTALSPEHVQGDHVKLGALSPALVEIIHRLRTDSGRLSRSWFTRALDLGVSEGQYVEVVGIVAYIAGMDMFCRSLGIPCFELAEPIEGEPTFHTPSGLTRGIAWVPMLLQEDASGPDADIYAGWPPLVGNVLKALSLIPDHVRLQHPWTSAHYIPIEHMYDPAYGRDLDRLGIELVASRVSAMNECFY